MSHLSYISDNDFENAVKKVVDSIRGAQKKADESLHENVIDPFSAIFDTVVDGINLNDWLKRERARQVQKTLQNAIGYFHQDIIGSIAGWQNLSSGQLVDVCNNSLQIIAEIKNKHNTVKGSDKKSVYDNLLHALGTQKYQGFQAYYVEIIPKKDKNNKIYNRPFTPSDNTTNTKRPPNPNIVIIKGQDFYDMATDVPDALSQLFDVLPDVIAKVAGVKKLSQTEKDNFRDLFTRAY